MDTEAIIDKNVAIGNDLTPLSIDEFNAIDAIAQKLGENFCRRCGYCLPCPQSIDIPTQFIFEAYLNKYQIPEWANERYASLSVDAADCIQCGQCEEKCPYNLPIIEMLKKVDQAFN
jgi:predicted aldo/keto reductase-like oxidoreductase